MRLSTKEKLVPGGARVPSGLSDSLDGIRSALFRTDSLAQAKELAEAVDATSLSAPDRRVRALPPLEQLSEGRQEQDTSRGELEKMEKKNDEERAVAQREADEKLAVLREEHAQRQEDRRVIVAQEMTRRLEEQHVANAKLEVP